MLSPILSSIFEARNDDTTSNFKLPPCSFGVMGTKTNEWRPAAILISRGDANYLFIMSKGQR